MSKSSSQKLWVQIPWHLPFHALIYTRTWGAICRTTYQHGASVPVDLRSGPQAVTAYTFNVCNSHCWCLCEHVYTFKFPLQFHVLPVPGKRKVQKIAPNFTATLSFGLVRLFPSQLSMTLDGQPVLANKQLPNVSIFLPKSWIRVQENFLFLKLLTNHLVGRKRNLLILCALLWDQCLH